MSQNIGTLITAAIRPNDSLDLIASAYASEIKGGRHSVATHTDMNAIYDVRRIEGMECYVIDEGLTYILSGGTTNADWTISTVDWNQISNIPTSLSGYGITDAWTTGETVNYLNSNYYSTAQTYSQTEINIILNGYYSSNWIDANFQTIIGMSEYYTSAQTDAILNNYYTSGETDTLLTNYSLTSHTHTLSGLTDVDLDNYSPLASGDTLIYKNGNWVNSAITISVDMSNYYTISQVDTIIDNLTGFTGLTNLHEMNDVDSGITSALNGQALGWDSSLGLWTNIDVAIDLSAYYTSAQTDLIFYNSAQTNALFSNTAHTHALSGLSDVDSGATDGQYLQYSAGTWRPVTSSALAGAYVHLTGDTMTGNLVFDFMTGITDRNLYVDNNGTVSEGDEIIELYLSGTSLINYITSGDTTSGGTVILWSGSTFVNTDLSAYTLYEGQRYIDEDYFYEYYDGNLHRTWYSKKDHNHDDRYCTIDQLSGGCLDWRYTSSNTLAGLLDTTINVASLTGGQILIYDETNGWINSAATGTQFTNSNPTPQTIGGIPAGSTFPIPQNMQEMWDKLLYPYQNPEFTSLLINGISGTYEYGTLLSAQTREFTWNTSNSVNVSGSSISISGEKITTTNGLDNDYSEYIYMSAITNTNTAITSMSWTISGIDTENNIFNRTMTILWKNRIFTASDNSSLSNDAATVRTYDNFFHINIFNYTILSGNSYTAFYVEGQPRSFSVKYVESSNAEQSGGFTTSVIQVNDAAGNPVTYTKYEQYIGGVGYSADATYHVVLS